MTDYERMIQAIKEYWFDLDTYTNTWPSSKFREMSYSRWAVDEILSLIYMNPEWSPMKAIEEFRSKMAEYRVAPTHYKENIEIFEIAELTAMDLEDILIAMI